MSKKQRSQLNISSEPEKNKSKKPEADSKVKAAERLRVVIIGLLMAAIFYPPYVRGLYFEKEQLPAAALFLGIFCLYWIYKYIKKDGSFLKTPVDHVSFGLMTIYFIVIIFAAGLKLAVLEWLKYCMYFAVFLMLSDLITSYRSKMLILWTMVASALGVCILGIDAAAGGKLVKAANGIVGRIFDLDYDLFFSLFNDNRLFSTLQYPNALASYLMAAFFVTVGIMAVSQKLWAKALTGGINAIFIVSFILTQSRGAYVMLPAAALIYILASPSGKRVKSAAYLLSSLIPSLAAAAITIGYATNPAADKSFVWSLVAAGVLVSGVFSVVTSFLVKWLEKVSWRIYASLAVFCIVIGAAGAFYLINTSAPLNFDKPFWVIKSTVLKPDQEYKLIYDVDASTEAKVPAVYSLNIISKNEKEIILNKATNLAVFYGTPTEGIEKRELAFKVPSDSRIVNITFASSYKDTKVWMDNAVIVKADTGEVERKLRLSYKYLPDGAASRLEDILATNSGLVRETYYKDGYRILKDRLLFGAGGGAWSLLYFQHQSFAYSTTQAHNYFLQVAVETGLIGLIILILLIGAISLMYLLEFRFKRDKDEKDGMLQASLFAGIAAMFMHSAIDFDLSLSAVFLFLWQLIGIFNSRYRYSGEGVNVEEYKIKLVNKGFETLEKLYRIFGKIRLKVYPLLGFAITAAIMLLPVSFISAKGYALKAGEAAGSSNIPEAIKYMQKAMSMDPFNPIYMVDYANMLISGKSIPADRLQEADKAVVRAERISKFNFYSDEVTTMEVLPLIAQYYFSRGESDKGLGIVNRNLALRPLWPEKWQDKLNAYFAVIMYHFDKDEPEEALKRIDQALNIIYEAAETNKDNMEPFIFNYDTQEMLEKLKYIKDYLTIKSEINIDRLVFYNMPGMDVNTDGIPDQWTPVGNTKIKYNDNKESIIIEGTMQGQVGIVHTRSLSLQPGKQYRIEAGLPNPQAVNSLSYFVTGVSTANLVMKPEGNIFIGEFTVSPEFKAGNNSLRLFVPGNIEIKNMRIIEKLQ